MSAAKREATPAHWADAYYGELYFDSAADLLTAELTALEAGVIVGLLGASPGDHLLDLACGHGRHALALAREGFRVTGLERSGAYLSRARGAPGASQVGWIRADLRALPFREGRFAGAFSWYASLFMFDDATHVASLSALGRCVERGRRVVVQHANPLGLALEPEGTAARELPGGGRVEERSRWDPASGVDRCERRLVRPDGSVLAGVAELRYYSPSEWEPLARAAGLRLVAVTSTSGAEPGPAAPDLVAVLERR